MLFNFYDATTVSLSGLIGGYVVAPNANVTEYNDIDGGVMAKNLTVYSEVNLPGSSSAQAWFGSLPDAVVPEMSNGLPGMSALVMLGVILWREQRKPGRPFARSSDC